MDAYLQEAGAIPLLTPTDEMRLAIQMRNAKIRLREILREWLPGAYVRTTLGKG
jgi:hypothetical protein